MIDRVEVADALEEIGLLLELAGENPFKTRAYDNAARVVDIAYGIDTARRGWCTTGDVLNTMTLPAFKAWLEQRRKNAAV